jgi:undecaprenyl phosphate N,N'-diacetylbacillosamine 1-phosphate transferase
MYRKYFKRLIDILMSLIIFIIAIPFLIPIFIILSISNKGHPFFSQSRPGKHGEIFKIIKFRTMNEERDDEGNLLPDFERITFFGKIIRNTSLDEIPQLLNVLKGEMSLIGPRPLLTEYLLLYDPFQKRRHEVRPGITGLAQVNGRNAITWDKKFEYDVWYVDNISFILDIRILFLTVLKIFKRENINQEDRIPMTKFKGNNKCSYTALADMPE